jgi:hypothetical protein
MIDRHDRSGGHGPKPKHRRERAGNGEAADAAKGSALALLEAALAGETKALGALRRSLDLPGAHEGAAKFELCTLTWDQLGLRLASVRRAQEALRRRLTWRLG